MIKRRQPASGLPAFFLIDIGESFSFHKCLYPIKTFTLHFFGLYFFSVSCNETDKNAQNRRISVSSPYSRTAETDFGERKSEYDKNQREAARLPFLNFELMLLKNLVLHRPLSLLKILTPSLFRSALFSASRVTRQIKMRRVVEYPFRRRTAVRQRRISAREKVKFNKIKGKPHGFPSLILS